MMCDFCSSPDIRWRLMAITAVKEFPVEVQEYTGLRGAVSEGDWAACDVCMSYIRAKSKEKLIERSYDSFLKCYPEFRYATASEKREIRHGLSEVQDVFWNNWTGLVEPHTDKI